MNSLIKEYKVVLDTNILVSILITKNPKSPIINLFKYLEAEAFIPIYSYEIMNEYKEVLNREKFDFDEEDINSLISLIEENGLCIIPRYFNEEMLSEVSDDKDKDFYKVFLELNELLDDKPFEHYLITGNTRHFPDSEFIITAREFVDILQYQSKTFNDNSFEKN